MDEPILPMHDENEGAGAPKSAQKKTRRDTWRILLIAFAAVLAIGILASAILNRGAGTSSPLSDTDRAQTQTEFPIIFPGNSVADVHPVGSAVCVLSGDSISFVKPNGKTFGTTVLSFAEPVLKTAGAYGVAYAQAVSDGGAFLFLALPLPLGDLLRGGRFRDFLRLRGCRRHGSLSHRSSSFQSLRSKVES